MVYVDFNNGKNLQIDLVYVDFNNSKKQTSKACLALLAWLAELYSACSLSSSNMVSLQPSARISFLQNMYSL